jgi:hypothetical protein
LLILQDVGNRRGASPCNVDPTKFATEIAVQFFVGCFFVLGKVQRTLLDLWRWSR